MGLYSNPRGFDYEETFSPVADIRAIRILLAIAAYYDYEIWQMDVAKLPSAMYISMEEQASGQWNKRFDGNEIMNLVSCQNADRASCQISIKLVVKMPYSLGIMILQDRSSRLIGFMSKLPSNTWELKCMQSVPYASAVGSIVCCEIVTALMLRLRSEHNKAEFSSESRVSLQQCDGISDGLSDDLKKLSILQPFDASKEAAMG
ncbi:retrotransposon protein, putative, ty1-copia subclass [Tanacetum coccineum]